MHGQTNCLIFVISHYSSGHHYTEIVDIVENIKLSECFSIFYETWKTNENWKQLLSA